MKFPTQFMKCQACGKMHALTSHTLKCTCGNWISESVADYSRRKKAQEARNEG